VALGRAAVEAGFRVRFFRADLLVEALCRGLADNSVGRLIDAILRRSDPVIVDELAFSPLDSLAEGEGFEPPTAWRPWRFSRALFDVLSGVGRCRPEYQSRHGCGASCRLVPPRVVGVRGIGGVRGEPKLGEPIHVTPYSKARRPCHCLRAAQVVEQRQISRHAHAVDELGVHKSALGRSGSPTPGRQFHPLRGLNDATGRPNTRSRSRLETARSGRGRPGCSRLLRAKPSEPADQSAIDRHLT